MQISRIVELLNYIFERVGLDASFCQRREIPRSCKQSGQRWDVSLVPTLGQKSQDSARCCLQPVCPPWKAAGHAA